jgi:BTB/POZ domain
MSKRKKTTISYSSIINDDERKSINSNVVARVGGSSNFGGGSDDEEIIDDTNNGSNGRSKTDIVSNTDPNCVKFDVGGRIFKVRRSLLESFPETMLARSASDLWNTTTSAVFEAVSTSQDDTSKKKRAVKKNRVHHEQQQQQPIFIDRDSHRFSYVLDYMRDGCVVVLPVTISKESFLTELQYF